MYQKMLSILTRTIRQHYTVNSSINTFGFRLTGLLLSVVTPTLKQRKNYGNSSL